MGDTLVKQENLEAYFESIGSKETLRLQEIHRVEMDLSHEMSRIETQQNRLMVHRRFLEEKQAVIRHQ